MVLVTLSAEAQQDFDALPFAMMPRVQAIFVRLQEWPNVSGAKPLRYDWKGHQRIRTGDWRVIFREIRPGVLVVRIKHRSEVYED
jgi:mRNA-degrading endonuclease RelE of RelBE toxin-antitoxin system